MFAKGRLLGKLAICLADLNAFGDFKNYDFCNVKMPECTMVAFRHARRARNRGNAKLQNTYKNNEKRSETTRSLHHN